MPVALESIDHALRKLRETQNRRMAVERALIAYSEHEKEREAEAEAYRSAFRQQQRENYQNKEKLQEVRVLLAEYRREMYSFSHTADSILREIETILKEK